MKNKIKLFDPVIGVEEENAILKVLKSKFWASGNGSGNVEKFENTFKKFIQSRTCVAVNSGTSALHIACKALGLKTGDILWTSPITFVASANCGLYCGASVDFVDIDPNTKFLSVWCLRQKLESC